MHLFELVEMYELPSAEERYLDEFGHDPPEAEAEFAWQWRYNPRSDREKLMELLQDECEAIQEALF